MNIDCKFSYYSDSTGNQNLFNLSNNLWILLIPFIIYSEVFREGDSQAVGDWGVLLDSDRGLSSSAWRGAIL